MMPIRCLALLLASLIAPHAATAADLLLDHVNGYTLDSSGKLKRFEAMLVDDGKVVAIGQREAMRKRADGAKIVDGQGRTLLPGLIDAHGHIMGLGTMKRQADLTSAKSLDEALAQIRAFASANAGSAWIVGRGWNQVIWKLGRFPTAKELDAVAGDRPVWLERVDGHAGWANSAAIQLAGVDRNTPDPAGGRIERGAEGHPSGVFVDSAMDLVTSKVPPLTPKQNAAALDAALAELARMGLTGVHDAGVDAQTIALYQRYADERRLTVRIHAMIAGTGADFDALAAKGPLSGYGGGHLDVRSVKLLADGALGSRGAALLAPYSDDPANRGLLFHSPDELTAMIGKALAKGYQVGVHAIGDAANREVLDSFEAAFAKHGGRELRNRIEHAQVVALADIPRFKSLGLVASMQPVHATSDMNMAEDRVGGERIKGAYAWRTFLDQGTVIAAGSDFPVESPNPFHGLYAAVTRQDQAGKPPGGWYPAQELGRVEAFRAFTLDAAWAARREDVQGTLEAGKFADFILVDRDIFAEAPSRLWSTVVLETWVGGKRVYARGEAI
ncbi:MAG: amidohydrolase [Lysobacteraceae bacterium]|nr:MAG: amidohydrolase [Xanthomonadaceae bacterium]